MSKQSPLKRYISISQPKIGMFDCQLPRHWWQSAFDWLLRIPRFKAGLLEVDLPAHDLPSQHQKLQQIIARLKEEHIGELIEAIHQSIYYYNNIRIHTSLGMSPVEFKKLYQKKVSDSVSEKSGT